MALETGNNIADLVATNPDGSDSRTSSDDHHRMIKRALKNAFAGFTGGVVVTGADGGTVNAYTVTPTTNALPSYADRLSVVFAPTVTNTGAVTINISGLGAKNIKRVDGSDLTAGEMASGSVYVAVYNGTEFRLLAPTLAYIMSLSLGTSFPTSPADSGKFLQSTGTGFQWSVAGIGNVATASGSSNVTLTSSSAGYQSISMTAMGKHVTLPDATSLTVGGPRYIIKNDGGYPFGIRDNAGALVMAVAAGGIAYVTLKDNSAAAGSWSVIGDNLEPGLITIDSTFSSTYASTVLAPFVALDSNASIHFAALSSGFAAFVVDNTGKVVGTPVTVSSTASDVPVQAFKITSTTAIVFYGQNGTATHKAVVLTVSGSSPSLSLAVGSSQTLTTANSIAAWGGENFTGAPKIAQLSSSLYAWSGTNGTSSTIVHAISVSGTAVTIGSLAVILASAVDGSTTTYALTATTALVLYKSGASAPYANNAVVISVSGTTCTVGTPAALTGVGSSLTAVPSSCLLSATKCLVQDDNNTAGSVIASVFTISGTTVTAGTLVSIENGITTSSSYTANSATRYNPHLFPMSSSTALLWYLDSGGISRTTVLSESGGTVTAGTILYRSISAAVLGNAGGGLILPQGTSEFCSIMQRVATASGQYHVGTTCKITGTTVTQGAANALGNTVSLMRADLISAARLSSGKYVIAGYGQDYVFSEMPVFSSNGSYIKFLGVISVPNINLVNPPVPPAVINDRVICLGATKLGTTVGASTYQLRLLSVEIAQ